MNNLPHLAQRFFNTPLAIAPGKIEVIMAALGDRFGITHCVRGAGPLAMEDEWDGAFDEEGRSTPYEVDRGIAFIPVTGTLVHKLGYLNPWSGMMGYDGIRAQLALALADKDVKAIMLDVDSPGGEVAGCFDLVDDIFMARGRKPMWASLSEKAFSAAYAIASAADRVIVPRTGGTGSVGVICAVVDLSRAYDKAGVSVELITYGSHKADGNEFSPLTKAARERFQADVDAMGELFVETTARNRKMASAKVRGTQALTYMGAAGVEIGFADAVMSPQQAAAALRKELS